MAFKFDWVSMKGCSYSSCNGKELIRYVFLQDIESELEDASTPGASTSAETASGFTGNVPKLKVQDSDGKERTSYKEIALEELVRE